MAALVAMIVGVLALVTGTVVGVAAVAPMVATVLMFTALPLLSGSVWRLLVR
jgi:hypothetical protein